MLPTLALVLVILVASARAQTPDPSAATNSPSAAAERRATAPEPSPVVESDGAPLDRPMPPRIGPSAPWREWMRGPGGRSDEGRMLDGTPFPGPDGRLCWPHGDHVHCR
jgi:hypothetical protein